MTDKTTHGKINSFTLMHDDVTLEQIAAYYENLEVDPVNVANAKKEFDSVLHDLNFWEGLTPKQLAILHGIYKILSRFHHFDNVPKVLQDFDRDKIATNV